MCVQTYIFRLFWRKQTESIEIREYISVQDQIKTNNEQDYIEKR